MKHTRQKSNGTKRHMLLLPVFLVAVVALIIGAAAPDSSASGYHHWRPEVSQFDEFEVFIEINATDLDAGLQGKLDGEAICKRSPLAFVIVSSGCSFNHTALGPSHVRR